MAADLGDVMDDLAVQLATVPGLRVFAFPPKSATPPFAFINLPEVVSYDLTYGRGQDRFTLDVWVGVADVVDRATRDALCALVASSGIKAAVEASTNYDYRVTQATFAPIQLAGGLYAGVQFTVDVGA